MNAGERFAEAFVKSEPQAFPSVVTVPLEDHSTYFVAAGLTKREWFAGMALQGILAAGANPEIDWENRACVAVYNADALIQRLSLGKS